MVKCCTCQWNQQDRSMSHLSFYDSEWIFLHPRFALLPDADYYLSFMHHYITKVCSCWAAFEAGPHFAVALACFLRNVGFAKVSFVHYILNEPSYPGNKKMNGFSKYPQCRLQLLWTVYCKGPQLISNCWPHYCRMVHLNPGTVSVCDTFFCGRSLWLRLVYHFTTSSLKLLSNGS